MAPLAKGKLVRQKETYKKIRTLGEGSYGKVFLVECGSDGSRAAIKQIDFKDMAQDEKVMVKREIALLE